MSEHIKWVQHSINILLVFFCEGNTGRYLKYPVMSKEDFNVPITCIRVNNFNYI